MGRGRIVAPWALWLLAGAAGGQALPGDLYVTEKASGSVANVRDGGSFGGQPRFATGLSAPTGICVTSEGKVLVAESGSGQVTDITIGGDFTGAGAFASGLDTPLDLLCTEDRILVVEGPPGGPGEITDITAGGSFAGAPSFAAGLGNGATGLALEAVNQRLYASDAAGARIFDVTSGGVFLSVPPFATNGAGTAGLAALGEQLLAANPGSGQVVDASGGGDLAALPVFATLPGVVNLLEVEGLGLFAASASGGALYDISAGGDFSGAAPFASGLDLDPAFVGLAHFGGCGDGILDPGEACDDGNVLDGDGCNATCKVRLCRVPPSDACVVARRASLSIKEKRTDKKDVARLALKLQGFDEAVAQSDFGDPVFQTTRFDVCVYGESDDLVAQMIVDRGFDTCGEKQQTCWKPIGEKGYRYSDKSMDSAGIGSILAVGGKAGQGKVQVKGQRTKKSRRLPRMAGALEGDSRATIQVVASDGRCFGAELPNVKRAENGQFKARK
jgi:cysteine-rich repeat protein